MNDSLRATLSPYPPSTVNNSEYQAHGRAARATSKTMRGGVPYAKPQMGWVGELSREVGVQEACDKSP
jgi:hypothetical protein